MIFIELWEDFENKFDYLENEIDIRVYSIKIELDEIEKKRNDQIDVFEKKVLRRNKLLNKFHINRRIESSSENIIGLFYNEFNDNQNFNSSYHTFSKARTNEIDDQSFLTSFIQINFKKIFLT